MRFTEKSFQKTITFLLLTFSLFTLAQAYYSAYIHITLLLLYIILCHRERSIVFRFLLSGVFICLLFVLLAIIKNNGLVKEHIGLYLHYITWPIIFVFVVKRYNISDIRKMLYYIIVICIIGDVLSLVQLKINPDLSRLLAGVHLENDKIMYYEMGVGGYGYVFAMAFLTFGVVRWLCNTDNKVEKILLWIFLVINTLFIINASYTTAIIITIALTGLALITNARRRYRVVIVICVLLFVFVFWESILKLCNKIATDLGSEWVAKRFEQLLYARENDNLDSLRRFGLYKKSWNTFLANPVFGGNDTGGHSQILDALAQYGCIASLLVVFFINCMKMCNKMLMKTNLLGLYLIFLIFAFVDTCNVMQLPAVVFFVIPLISFIEMDGKRI